MRENARSEDPTYDLDSLPADDAIATRAAGRPPEERSSEVPKEQAQAILEETEERIEEAVETRDG